MKLSNKPNAFAGIILLLLAAFFSISLLTNALDIGELGQGNNNILFEIGKMLFSVYGFSSLLIPIFLLTASIFSFSSKWTARKSMCLLTAIIPFWTSVFIEKICRTIVNESGELNGQFFLTLLTGWTLCTIEVLGAIKIADKITSKKVKSSKNLTLPYYASQNDFQNINDEQTDFEIEKTFSENAAELSQPTDLVNLSEIEQTETQTNFESDEEIVDNFEESEKKVNIDDDPFADVFDENGNSNAGSMISNEEFEALTNFDEDFSEKYNQEYKEENAIDWPEPNEIANKAKASLSSSADFNPDEDLEESNEDAEESCDEEFCNEYNCIDTEYSHNASPTLDPDFFDIDPDAEPEDSLEDDNHEIDYSTENDENIENDENELIEESKTDSENDFKTDQFNEFSQTDKNNEENSKVFANSNTFDFGCDIFSDMEEDARNEFCNKKQDINQLFPQENINSHQQAYSVPAVNLTEEFDSVQTEKSEFTEPVGQNDFEPNQINVTNSNLEESDLTIQTSEKLDSEQKNEEKSITQQVQPVYKDNKSSRVRPKPPYEIPTNLLNEYADDKYWIIDEQTKKDSLKLKDTLQQFNIEADVIGIQKGPVVTMFELLPAPGVKLSKIVNLQDNIALNLAASSVRIVAPIPGKAAVGIEVPNKRRSIVSFREIIEKDLPEYQKMAIPVILGKDVQGRPQLFDLVKTPHLLIAGSTGAGKSVCVNTMILSILYKRSPEQVKLILVDPKVVELKLYNDIPHLLTPVITEPKRALQSLQYCLCEMERRYALLDGMSVRDINSYNKRIEERHICTEKLPYIIVIIDEFADLMATTGKDLETTIARLAAMSRAVGIHLVLATQRPSTDVITGLIKANIPSRIAFMVASQTDSRIIIDKAGAEKLLGKGDMLYAGAVDPYPVRIQGTFVSDEEVENVVEFVKTFGEPDYIDDEIFVEDDESDVSVNLFNEGSDPLYEQALDVVLQAGKASASYIQRRLKIGYNRAARLIEEMEERGIIGPANGSKPREIIHVPN